MFDIILFLIVLSALIFVHEFGHFLAAKFNGVAVEEFGLGLPPKIFSLKRGETEFSINALPIGGFVRLLGEENEDTNPHSFFSQPALKKIQIVGTGVAGNLIFAFLVFFIGYAFLAAPEADPNGSPIITRVIRDSPAYEAGLKMGDLPILIIADSKTIQINTSEDVKRTTRENAGRIITLVIEREHQQLEFQMIPRLSPPPGQGPLGLEIVGIKMVRYPLLESFIRAGSKLVSTTQFFLLSLARLFKSLVTLKPNLEGISGPVGLFEMFSKTKSLGVGYLTNLLGIVSLSLALINILPLPALDGGRILFIALKEVLPVRINPRAEALIHRFGLIILLILAILITIKDVAAIL